MVTTLEVRQQAGAGTSSQAGFHVNRPLALEYNEPWLYFNKPLEKCLKIKFGLVMGLILRSLRA